MADVHRQSWAEILAVFDAAFEREVLGVPHQQETVTPEHVKARMEKMGYQCVHVNVVGDTYYVGGLDDGEIESEAIHKSMVADFLKSLDYLAEPCTSPARPEDLLKFPCIYTL